METEAIMKKLVGVVSHHEWEVKELRKDPEFAAEYLKLALESLTDPDDCGASLLMLRALAQAYGGLGAVAAKAGISRESLYRSLSPKGNPTLKTLVAVLNTMDLRLSVVPQSKAAQHAKKPRKRSQRKPAKASRARAA
jgi:probable addiction module antidote protein